MRQEAVKCTYVHKRLFMSDILKSISLDEHVVLTISFAIVHITIVVLEGNNGKPNPILPTYNFSRTPSSERRS
jgi:hypothetical protein